MFRKRKWLWLVILVLIVGGGGGYYYYTNVLQVDQLPEGPQIQTSRARRGDLVISATGAGTVIPAIEIRMGVETGGLLTELNVQAGDQVKVGDVLAGVDDLNYRRALASAELQLARAELDLTTARQDHAELLKPATESETMNAEAALATAQEPLDALREPPSPAEIADAEAALATAQDALEELNAPATEPEMADTEASLATAQAALDELVEPASPAEIAEAEAAVATAQEAYERLINGPDAVEMERAQLNLDRAKNSLWSSQMSRDSRGNARDRNSGAYDQAQVTVLNGEISVRLAELDLAALKEPATPTELQDGRAKVLQARERLADLRADPGKAEIASAEARVQQAQRTLDDLKAGPSEAELASAEARVLQAQETLADLRAGPSVAEMTSAEAKVAQAQEALDELLAGPSEDDVAISAEKVRQAEMNRAQAELSLEAAEKELAGTTLFAPIDGTILEVTAEVGERVSDNTPFITVADLSSPMLEIFVDETDMDMIAVGYEVEVELDAIPEVKFAGHVIQVDPALVREDNSDVIRGLVALDSDSFAKPQGLIMGLNATVDVIGGRAEGAVLVPVEALRELGEGEYAVFVMEDGELRLRVVEVSLQDFTYAAITSGLNEGETVSTGIVETR